MNKYLAHVEWTVKYDGRDVTSKSSDMLVESAPFVHLKNADYDLVSLSLTYTPFSLTHPERLTTLINADICDENNKFILSTKAEVPLKKCSKDHESDEKYISYEGRFIILVPKSEKEN